MTKMKVFKYIGFAFALLLPGVSYVFFVDFGMFDKAEHWAEIGTTIGGLYTPTLTIFMILVLLKQSNIQEEQTRIQKELAEDKYNNQLVRDLEQRFSKHLSGLEIAIENCQMKYKPDFNQKIIDISSVTCLSEIDEYRFEEIETIARKWRLINSSLLGTQQSIFVYSHANVIMQEELKLIFSHDLLVALDKIGVYFMPEFLKEHCSFWFDKSS